MSTLIAKENWPTNIPDHGGVHCRHLFLHLRHFCKTLFILNLSDEYRGGNWWWKAFVDVNWLIHFSTSVFCILLPWAALLLYFFLFVQPSSYGATSIPGPGNRSAAPPRDEASRVGRQPQPRNGAAPAAKSGIPRTRPPAGPPSERPPAGSRAARGMSEQPSQSRVRSTQQRVPGRDSTVSWREGGDRQAGRHIDRQNNRHTRLKKK